MKNYKHVVIARSILCDDNFVWNKIGQTKFARRVSHMEVAKQAISELIRT